MKTIINADDFGFSNSINDAIIDLLSKGKITSASLIANGSKINEAIVASRTLTACSFSVHLNLTELKPFTNNNVWKKYGIVDEKNEFCKTIRSITPNPEIKQAVFDEFSAQIDFLLKEGAQISHIDSHHHIHTIPWLFFILKKIQKKYGIYKARSSLNLYKESSVYNLMRKQIWNVFLRYYITTQTTDYFTPFLWFVDSLHRKVNSNKTIELMVHPNENDKNAEYQTLYSDWQKKMPFKIELISYNQI